jgi:hypothetical protein
LIPELTMTTPMESMSNPVPPSLEPAQIVLVRKIILLSLLMIVAALGLVLLLRHIQIYSLIFPHILSDAAMGLIAGVSARWVLRNQTVFLRIISILAFLIGGLELLGWFTGWQIGFGPLKFGLSRVDWSSLGQLLLAAGVSLLTLYAWTEPTPAPVQPSHGPLSNKRPAGSRQSFQKRRRPVRSRSKTAPALEPETPISVKDKDALQRKPVLQLSDEEEHRCPYCLELIDIDDPRGIVECKICHTLHHADCWAITGACQVPHFTV